MSWGQVAMFALGEAMKNQHRMSEAVRVGAKEKPRNASDYVRLFPQNGSIMTIQPLSHKVLASSANNILPATLDGGTQSGGGNSLAVNQTNLARMGGDPKLDEPIKDYDPLASGKPSSEGGPIDLKDPSDLGLDSPTTPQRLPKTPEEMAHEIELQKMSDRNAMIRQGISSAGSFLGTMMRPPSAVTVGGYRPNPNLQMFRRRRGLMSG